MGHRKPTKDALKRQVIRVRGRAEAYGRTHEFGAYKRIVDAFLSDPTRRDGRGISTGAIADAHLGYVRLGEALLIAEEHEDHAVRHQAKKALRAIGRGHDTFEGASERLKKVRGANRQAGKRRQEGRRTDREMEIRLNARFSVKRIHSVKSLQAVGRSLENCCSNARTAREYLRHSEMWMLLDRGEPRWLLAVDTDRNISECEGHDGVPAKPAKLGRQAVRRLLGVLNASADEEPAFVRAGYHSALLHADIEDDAPVLIDGREFTAHCFEDWVLVGRRKPGKRWTWSPFRRTERGSLEEALAFEQPISEGMLLGLVVRCPELGAKLRR